MFELELKEYKHFLCIHFTFLIVHTLGLTLKGLVLTKLNKGSSNQAYMHT